MGQNIDFYKMVASGNDFVVVDNTHQLVKDPGGFAKRICDRHEGVGADGVLLYERSQKGDFKMRILNADGSEAEACGNGFRCIALYASEKMGFPSRVRFESLAGFITAEIKRGRVRVEMPKPTVMKLRNELIVSRKRLHYSFVNTGVPHAVIFVEGLDQMDTEELGRAIRYHKKFEPRGTNVDFVEVNGNDLIHVRTFERGVEAETKACGTGSVASAILAFLVHHLKTPVRVVTRSGETLIIDFKVQGKKISEVTLEGDARFVYEGKYVMESPTKNFVRVS